LESVDRLFGLVEFVYYLVFLSDEVVCSVPVVGQVLTEREVFLFNFFGGFDVLFLLCKKCVEWVGVARLP
jgi:hypothetical protein